MKVKKRLFAGFLALAMVLCMNLTVFASGTPSIGEGGPVDSVTLIKTYQIVNKGTTSPAEDFSFTVTGEGVTDATEGIDIDDYLPTVASYKTKFGANTADENNDIFTNTFTINLPQYDSVGIYTYQITETAGTTMGVTYANPITMNVTVVNKEDAPGFDCYVALYNQDGTKITDDAAFLNKYEAGTLSISKNVEGRLGDKNKYFAFEVTLKLPEESDNNMNSTIGVGATTYLDNPDTITIGQTTVFYLKHGETLNLTNIPYGVEYTVAEVGAGTEDEEGENGYLTSVAGKKDSSIAAASQTVTFTNTKGGEGYTPDTGVYLDNLPYIIVFAGVLAAVAVLVIRRRRVDD